MPPYHLSHPHPNLACFLGLFQGICMSAESPPDGMGVAVSFGGYSSESF